MPFQHQLRVRYGECDQQGVAYNAHYMAYIDDATEVWVRGLAPMGDYLQLGWDWMVVRSVIEWQSSARNGDLLDIAAAIVRYGDSSFDFGFVGTIAGRPVFKARSVCVSVAPVTLQKIATPGHVRALLGEAEAWDVPR